MGEADTAAGGVDTSPAHVSLGDQPASEEGAHRKGNALLQTESSRLSDQPGSTRKISGEHLNHTASMRKMNGDEAEGVIASALVVARACEPPPPPPACAPGETERGADVLCEQQGLHASCPWPPRASCSVRPPALRPRSPCSPYAALTPVPMPAQRKEHGKKSQAPPGGGGSMIWIQTQTKASGAEAREPGPTPLRRCRASFSTRTRCFAWCGT